MAGRLVLICGDSFHQTRRLSTYPFPFMPPFKNYNIKDKLFDSISTFLETNIIIVPQNIYYQLWLRIKYNNSISRWLDDFLDNYLLKEQ